MPKSNSSYSLVIDTKKVEELKLTVTSPKVAKEIIAQLKAAKITAAATLTVSKTLSTNDK